MSGAVLGLVGALPTLTFGWPDVGEVLGEGFRFFVELPQAGAQEALHGATGGQRFDGGGPFVVVWAEGAGSAQVVVGHVKNHHMMACHLSMTDRKLMASHYLGGDMAGQELVAAQRLLDELRELYRTNDTSGAYRRVSDAYEAALADLPQIPERQRRNVYEQSLYAETYSPIQLTERIDAARAREATRTVRILECGLRVETVESWSRRIINDKITSLVDVEVYDSKTDELWDRRVAESPADVADVAMAMYVKAITDRRAQLEALADPDCERCEGSGFDPDMYTVDEQAEGGKVFHLAEPCRDCVGEPLPVEA